MRVWIQRFRPGFENYFKLEVLLCDDSMKTLKPVLAPHNLPYQMRLLVQLLTRKFQDVIAPFDLTPLHWGVLSCLWEEDGLATRQISLRLEQLGGNLTVGLDSMEKRKLIRRKTDARDRRVSHIWLTKRGAALQAEVVPLVSAYVERVFGCLSPREAGQLFSLVTRLKAHVEGMDSESQ
jgi:DNA-binding MarR family transcriptional regulator